MNMKVNAIRKKLMKQREELLSEAEQTINSKLGAEKQSFPDPTDQAARNWTTISCSGSAAGSRSS